MSAENRKPSWSWSLFCDEAPNLGSPMGELGELQPLAVAIRD
jgi:hypothetical protein